MKVHFIFCSVNTSTKIYNFRDEINFHMQRIRNNSTSNWEGGRNELLYEDENCPDTTPNPDKGVKFTDMIFHSENFYISYL